MAMRTRALVSLAVGGLLLIPLTAYWFLGRSPVPERKLAQLRVGMSKQEVQTVLGVPNAEWPDGTWVYAQPLGWPVVLISFDDYNLLHQFDLED